MKIVVATGLFPPDVGGPALYAAGVAESLKKLGHEAPVAWFGALRGYPSGIRHVLFFFKLWHAACGATAIFAFDTSTVGTTATLVGALNGIPVVVRIGGDFVWESYVERTKDLVPLPDFYRSSRPLNLKESLAKRFVRWTLRHSIPAFNAAWLRDIWREPYGITIDRTHVVRNVIPPREASSDKRDRSILLYGRQIALKNADAFRRAFQQAGTDLELKEGIVPHAELMARLHECYAVAVPSISEVAPNMIIEAICAGKPFLLTKYSSYAERYRECGIMIDPLDEHDMTRGIREIADPAVYEKLQAHIMAYSEVRTYEDVANDFLAILRTL